MKIQRVAIGVIFNDDNQVLLAKRQKSQFMAGFWEFAGGKIEPNETPNQALKRELKEELNIVVAKTKQLPQLIYKYPEKTIELNIFLVLKYNGEVANNEGQKLELVEVNLVKKYHILPTVMPILNKLILPKIYHIVNYSNNWFFDLERKVQQKIELLQMRSKVVVAEEIIQKTHQICQKHNIKLLLNIPNFSDNCDGYHLTSEKLKQQKIPTTNKIISASTHNQAELELGEKLQLDFAVLSPIKATKTHPNAKPLGFENAQKVLENINIPVYFLGGMQIDDLDLAQKHNAFGVAGISKF